jgi:hypothetical protein
MPVELENAFEERLGEVEAYLSFLEEMELASQAGAPRFGPAGAPLTQRQAEILRAGVFVQLYNLVEATMTRCLDALATSSHDGRWLPSQLVPAFRKEWIKVAAGVNVQMNPETRLEYATKLVELLVGGQSLKPFKIEKGGGGNWDDELIEALLRRLGVTLILAPGVRTAAKRPYRDDMRVMRMIMKMRNDLAHGNISFAECGENETSKSLREVTHAAAMYLRSIVRAIERYIERHEFLEAAHRPA